MDSRFTSKYLVNQHLDPFVLLEAAGKPAESKALNVLHWCPFHEATKPLLWIYMDKLNGPKFMCSQEQCQFRAGDGVDFLAHLWKLDHRKTLDKLNDNYSGFFADNLNLELKHLIPLLADNYRRARNISIFVRACHQFFLADPSAHLASDYLGQFGISSSSYVYHYGVCTKNLYDFYNIEDELDLPVEFPTPTTRYLVIPYWSDYHTVSELRFLPFHNFGGSFFRRVCNGESGYFGLDTIAPEAKQVFFVDGDIGAAAISSDFATLTRHFLPVISVAPAGLRQGRNGKQGLLKFSSSLIQAKEIFIFDSLAMKKNIIAQLLIMFPHAHVVALPYPSARHAVLRMSSSGLIDLINQPGCRSRLQWTLKYLQESMAIGDFAFREAFATCQLSPLEKEQLRLEAPSDSKLYSKLKDEIIDYRSYNIGKIEFYETTTGYGYRRFNDIIRHPLTNFTFRFSEIISFEGIGQQMLYGSASIDDQTFPVQMRSTEIHDINSILAAINRNAGANGINKVATVYDTSMRTKFLGFLAAVHNLSRLPQTLGYSHLGWNAERDLYVAPNWKVEKGKIILSRQPILMPFPTGFTAGSDLADEEEFQKWIHGTSIEQLAWRQILYLLISHVTRPVIGTSKPIMYGVPSELHSMESVFLTDMLEAFGSVSFPSLSETNLSRHGEKVGAMDGKCTGFPFLINVNWSGRIQPVKNFLLDSFGSFSTDIWVRAQVDTLHKLPEAYDHILLPATGFDVLGDRPSQSLLRYLFPRVIGYAQLCAPSLRGMWQQTERNPYLFGHAILAKVLEINFPR